jgi:polyisoprenoid-binding protein YceI
MIASPMLLLAVALLGADAAASSPIPTRVSYRIDVPRSRFVVHTVTTGLSSMFGHDHKIGVGNYSGEVNLVPGDPATASLELLVRADSLRAVEEVQEDAYEKIDAALRDHVLHTSTYPTISFKSSTVTATPREDRSFDVKVLGVLELHGVRRKVTVPCRLSFQGDTLRATGTLPLRQRDFRIPPFSFAGGTVSVANRVSLSFTIVATKVTGNPTNR